MSIRNILKNLISNYEYYLIFSYILTILGIIINSYININSNVYFILYVMILLISLLYGFVILQIKIDADTKKEYIKLRLCKWNYIKLFKGGMKQKGEASLNMIIYSLLILIPIIIGGWYHAIFISTSQSYLKLIVIAFEMSLFSTMMIRGMISQKNQQLSILYIILMPMTLIFIYKTPVNFLNKLSNYIIYNLTDVFTILIALIMLCIGLSALSFGYCSILKEGSNIRCNMKRNGEGYFIASILIMIAIFLLLITSIMKKYILFTTLPNLVILNFDFIILNIYAVFIIIIFTFTIYASYCMLKCSILSLKELNISDSFL